MTYPSYQNLIGGQWVAAATGKTMLNLNPADHSDVIGAFPSSHAEDVALAVAAAKKAFATWRLVPAPKRAEVLVRAGTILVQNKEKHARDMTREMGKVLAETRGDVQEAIDEAFYVAGEGRRLFGITTPSELQNKFAMSVRMPIGVVGLITPWNFPMAIPSWKLFPALVAGNTCVIKPATDTPLSTYNLVQALIDAGLPAWRGQHRLRHRFHRRRSAGRASRCPRHQLHRLQRRRIARRPARRRHLQAGLA